jgi:glycosyltransferase involved in cell wall biosynthesis
MISIVIPVYNQASKLDKCLESIVKQTYDNYEIFIIDDGSTDNAYSVVEKYKKIIGFKLSYSYQENKGANAARNAGARKARGEFIIFCDADIILRNDMLEKMRYALKQNINVSYVYSSHKFGFKTFNSFPFGPERLRRMPYIHTTSLIRLEHFPGFDEKIKRLQDWDLWLTMLEKGYIGTWLREKLFVVQTGGTMSSWLPSFAYKLFPFLPKVRDYKEAVKIIKAKHNL